MSDCFEQIIGLSQTGCSCFTSDFSEAAKKSNSGLYMDELPESSNILKQIKGTAGQCKSIEDVFTGARENAIRSFKEQVYAEIGTRYTVRQNPYKGIIGQTGFNGPLSLSVNFFGMAVKMQPFKGATIKVNRVFLALNQTGSFDIKVYKAYSINNEFQIQNDGVEVATITANAEANKSIATVLPTPVELPAYDDSAHLVYYLFIIDRTESQVQPMDNKASCGCSNQQIMERWGVQGGLSGNDLEHIQTSRFKTGTTANINGIVLDAEIKCNDMGFVCENYNNNPFVRTAIEHAVLYEAVSNLLQGVLRSGEINRFALTGREQMATDAAILHNKFKSRVSWIAENMDMSTNTCFTCNNLNQSDAPYKTMIRL